MGVFRSEEIGCLKSHYNVLLKSVSELVLVCEDDFELCDDFDNKLKNVLSELPDDFEVLWLGGRKFGKKIGHSEHLFKVENCTGLFGVIYNRPFIPKAMSALAKENKLADWAVSSVLSNGFMTKEKLIKHKAGISTLQKKYVDYPDLR